MLVFLATDVETVGIDCAVELIAFGVEAVDVDALLSATNVVVLEVSMDCFRI